MTLALSLGMSIGVRKTLWMMAGELTGVALVSILSVIGVATMMLNHPTIFSALKYLGGGYLIYLGSQQWLMRGRMNIGKEGNTSPEISARKLVAQGFVTAIANPKGWAFMVSLLPSFINPELPMPPQLIALVLIILCTEFVFLMLYASGGKSLGRLLGKSQNVLIINRIAGSLIIILGLLLVFG